MGQLPSKLRKNNISLIQICSPKFYENILKDYRLTLLKGITIPFNHHLHTTSESPATLSDGLLVQVNAAIILAFSFHGVFLLNHAAHIRIKGVAVWGVKRSDV